MFALAQAQAQAKAASGYARLECHPAPSRLDSRTKVKCLAVTCDLHLPDEQWAKARTLAAASAWALRGLFIIYATSQNEAKFRFKQQQHQQLQQQLQQRVQRRRCTLPDSFHWTIIRARELARKHLHNHNPNPDIDIDSSRDKLTFFRS